MTRQTSTSTTHIESEAEYQSMNICSSRMFYRSCIPFITSIVMSADHNMQRKCFCTLSCKHICKSLLRHVAFEIHQAAVVVVVAVVAAVAVAPSAASAVAVLAPSAASVVASDATRAGAEGAETL